MGSGIPGLEGQERKPLVVSSLYTHIFTIKPLIKTAINCAAVELLYVDNVKGETTSRIQALHVT